ncbi:MAG: 50S ribosomal protein L18 [candidate division Zixibacteria bacterium]|nr:50S ribosomal protein L18 [candidate division Zixibacteria bacterium]
MAKDHKLIRAERRRRRVRAKVAGTSERPRLTVAKSLKNVFAQIIDDEKMVTLAACSSLSKEIISKLSDKKKTEAAAIVGEELAKQALAKGIKLVAFDRNRNIYHGRIKALAEAARGAGLEF